MTQPRTLQDMVAAIKADVVAKSAQDAVFRAELLADPQAAVERFLGTDLPAPIQVRAIAEAPDTYIVVLPAPPRERADGELSDADLEAVAGGAKAGQPEQKKGSFAILHSPYGFAPGGSYCR